MRHIAPLQLDRHWIGTGGIDEERELIETRLSLLGRARTDAGTDEQRPLTDDLEIGLGRSEPLAAPRGDVDRSSRHPIELHGEVEDVHDRSAEPHARTRAEINFEHASRHMHGHLTSHEVAPMRNFYGIRRDRELHRFWVLLAQARLGGNLESREDCLHEASECDRLAQLATTQGTRTLLAVAAFQWRKLAEEQSNGKSVLGRWSRNRYVRASDALHVQGHQAAQPTAFEIIR